MEGNSNRILLEKEEEIYLENIIRRIPLPNKKGGKKDDFYIPFPQSH